MLDGYSRSTRYSKLGDSAAAKFLAMHEFEGTATPPNTRLVVGTEWAKKVLGSAQSTNTQKWEFISEFSKSGAVGEAF
jgi:hypothetical protein